MANNVTNYNQPLPPAPAKSRARIEAGQSLRDRFVTGIAMPYPIMSIRGKEFAIKHAGQEHVLGTEVELILINSSDKMNKAFYEKGYDGGNDQPDCFSFDAIKPDPSSPKLQSPTCIGCDWNKFRSARGQQGEVREGKACSDSRKLVLAFKNDLLSNQLGPIMLRVPVTSHQNLKAYVDYIARGGFEPNACTTKLTFARGPDGKVLSYPKLEFAFGEQLTDDEYELAMEWEHDERTERILSAPPEGEQPSSEGMSQAQPVYNTAMGASRPRPTPVPSEPRPAPAPQPTPQPAPPAPEPTPLPPAAAAPGAGDAIGDRQRRRSQVQPRHAEVGGRRGRGEGAGRAGAEPRLDPAGRRADLSARGYPAGNLATAAQDAHAAADRGVGEPEPEPTPEPEAPKTNGKAQAAPQDLDAILGAMMPKR